MAGLIKGQILKHLSKFAKNLSPNSINLSTLRGEGELRDLELNEAVLTDVLDLPTWLQLTKATCNRVSIKIQWTKLKSQPICLYLDEVEVTMETCDDPREPVAESLLTAAGPSGKYGLAESIIDGMFVSINSVLVNFKAKTFVASIQLSRIIIESKTPTWHSAESLRMTRIKDERRGEILIFKEAEWMTLRIEANALEGVGDHLATTPLRLIANQSKIRITIKKRLIDCGIIASRLQINLDDLLWVLTDSQLKAALVFVNSLKDVIAKSARLSKKLAAERLKRQGYIPSPVHSGTQYRSPSSNKPGTKAQQAVAKVFSKFDIKETSYHLYTGRIDLHLCDDAAPEDENHRRKVEGGAMQVTLFKMGLDFYPYHPAGTDRSHWLKYDKNSEKRDQWAAELLSAFKDDVRKVREAYLTPHPSPMTGASSEGQTMGQAQCYQAGTTENVMPSQGPQVGHAQGPSQFQNLTCGDSDVNAGQPNTQTSPAIQHSSSPQAHLSPQGHPLSQGQRSPQIQTPRPTKLLESCTVFRLEDFALYRVSTALDHKRRVPTKFMTSDKQRLFLPQEMSSLHAEYTEYYFPEGIDYPAPKPSPMTNPTAHTPNLITIDSVDDDFVIVDRDSFLSSFVPHSNLYTIINPIFLKMDFLTVLWLNAFVLNLLKKANIPESEGPKVHMDIKLEALMPRIVIPAESPVEGQSDRPTALQVQASQVAVTNCRIGNTTSKFQLLKTLDEFNRGRLFKDTYDQFPRSADDLVCVPPCFALHLEKEDSPYFDKTVESVLRGHGVPNDIQRATNELLNPLKKSQSTTGLMYYNMMADSFKMDATKDIWSVSVDQLWLEFVGVPSSRNRPVPFVEAFPLTLWIAKPLLSLHSESSVTVLSQSDSSISPSSASSSGNSPGGDTGCPPRSSSAQRLKDYYGLNKGEPANGPRPAFKATSTGDKRDAQPVSRLGDVHVITNLTAKISVQLNHYQYLFLMRLVETVTSFLDEMEEDTVFIKNEPPPQTKISLSVIVKEVELALVCPPIPEIPSLQISPEDSEELFTAAEAQVKDVSGSQCLDSQISDRGDSALGISLQSGRSLDCSDGTLVQKSSSEMDVFSDGSQEVTSDIYPTANSIPVTMTTSDHTDLSSPQIHIGPAAVGYGGSQSASPTSRSPSHNSNGRVPQIGQQQHPELMRKDSDIKKSFTAMANFTKGVAKKINKSVTEKVKQNMRTVDTDELSVSDDLETMSIRSGSSEEDDFILTKFQNQQEAPAFESKFAISDDTSAAESSSEYRDEGGSMQNLAGPLDRAQGVVSVVCFKVHNSEIAISIKGKDVAVAATVDHVIPEEHGNVNLDKFHDHFISLSKENKSFSVESLPRLQDSPIRIRFIKGPEAEKVLPYAGEKGFLRAEILDFHAKFLTSTLSSLGELFDDEKVPEVLLMFIRVENTTVVIKDNKPPTHEISSPTKEPVELFITKLHVLRKEDGQFRISAEEFSSELTGTPPSEEDKKLLAEPTLMLSEVKHLRERVAELETQRKLDAAKYKNWPKPEDVQQLQLENDQLRRHLEKIGKMSTSSGGFNIELLQEELEQWKEKARDRKRLQKENEKLLEELTTQADELLTLKQERESLLATIGFLQEELSQSEQMRFKIK